MEEFYTRQTANEGVELPLFHPDGTKSDHWIKVRGIDSDQFRTAEAKAKRNAIELAQIKNEQKRAQAVRDTELDCIAVLVSAWSFDKACNHTNVVNFLREAPQIADMVNQFAARRAEFFGKKSKSSASGSGRKSNSKNAQKDPR